AVDPLIGFDISFMLSVAATGGLMLLQRKIASLIAPVPVVLPDAAPGIVVRAWRTLAAALATTMSATIGCAPLLAFIAPSLPIGGVIANLFAVPIGELLALPLCLAHTLLGFAPHVERGDALVASGSLLVVRWIAHATQRATWLACPVPSPTAWQSTLVWSIALAMFFLRPRRRVALAFTGATLLTLSEIGA